MSWKETINALTSDDWGLYDIEGVDSATGTLNSYLILLAQDAFLKVSQGVYTLAHARKFVEKEFASFRKAYYKFGAEDTVVNEIADHTIKSIFTS